MKNQFRLFLLLIPFSVFSQEKLTSNATPERVQGAWDCIYSVYDNRLLAAEETGPWGLQTPDKILFEDDSLFEFNYPCELANRRKISISNDTIRDETVHNGPPQIIERDDWPAAISFEGDTLVIKTGNENVGNGSTTKRYIRTQLDSNIVKRLKKIHAECKLSLRTMETGNILRQRLRR